MLGFEIVGFAIGIASVLPTLMSCFDFYQRFSGFPTNGRQAQMYVSMVHCEYIRLLLWAHSVGQIRFHHLPIPPPSIPLGVPAVRDAVEGILAQVLRNFDECSDLIKKYVPESSTGPSNTPLALAQRSVPQYFDIVSRQRRQQEKEEKTQKGFTWRKKLGWVIAGDEKKFKLLVEELRNANNSLQQMVLCPPEVVQLDRSFQNMALSETSEQYGLEMLREAASGTYERLCAAATVRNWQENNTLSSAGLRLNIEDLADAPTHAKNSWSVARYQKNRITQPGPEVTVIVEWKPFIDRNQPEEYERMSIRVCDTARLLHGTTQAAGFHTLNCMGYLRDISNPRYGFVYQLPPGANTSTAASLLDRIMEDRKQPCHVPLGERFRIAAKIAQAIHQILLTGWLHKSIRSENIVGFDAESPITNPPTATAPRWGISPFITGFTLARLDDPIEYTEKPNLFWEHDRYRHPEYLNNPDQRYKKIYDIYSFGVVLMEIAYWVSARGMLTSKKDLAAFQAYIVSDERMGDLKYRVGEVYQGVVRRCLKGDSLLPGSDNENDENMMLISAFHTQVVVELERCEA